MNDQLIVERLQDIRICGIGLRRVAANRIKALTEQYEEAYQYALHLAKALRENYPPNPDFRFLGDLVGLLTQIDNMVAGLSQPAVQPDREHVAFSMWKAEADRAAPNVGKNRTPEGFAEASDQDRTKWLMLADAAIRALIDKPAHVDEKPKSEHEAAVMLMPATKGRDA